METGRETQTDYETYNIMFKVTILLDA